MNDKKRIAFHEAGHATACMVWDMPWKSAAIRIEPNGNWGGIVTTGKYIEIENESAFRQKFNIKDWTEFMVKDWSRCVAGLMSEEIYLNKLIDWSTESIGSGHDLMTADTLALNFMDAKFYSDHFAPNLFWLTKEFLKANWKTCVLIIADELYNHEMTTPSKVNQMVGPLIKPSQEVLIEIIQKTPWKQ